MNSTPKEIAYAMFLNEERFEAFVAEHGGRYTCDDGTVSTFDVDGLLDAYKAHIGEDTYRNDRLDTLEEIKASFGDY